MEQNVQQYIDKYKTYIMQLNNMLNTAPINKLISFVLIGNLLLLILLFIFYISISNKIGVLKKTQVEQEGIFNTILTKTSEGLEQHETAKDNMIELRTDVDVIKNHISSVKDELEYLKTLQSNNNSRLDNLNKQLDSLPLDNSMHEVKKSSAETNFNIPDYNQAIADPALNKNELKIQDPLLINEDEINAGTIDNKKTENITTDKKSLTIEKPATTKKN